MIRPSSPLVPALLVLCCFFIGGVSRSEAEEASAAGWKKLEFTGQPLEGLRVALDVGHSRLTPGAISARGRGEFLFNVSTARVIAGFLEKAGAKVILINADGAITGLADRAVLAGKEKADCFISVHHDSVNDKYLQNWVHEGVTRPYADNFRGYSVFASSKNAKADRSREIALAVGAAMFESGLKPTLHHNEPIQGENRPLLDARTGVYEFTDLVVLKSAEMPAILLECGVIIHREEELLVQDPAYQDLIAHAVVKALATVFPREKKKGLFKLFGTE
ncbi:MAG: N-acetylmuramoyl-L-alanine amidase [Verrucomicrobiales bacterium]|jgi:N-acetylmuramoyl-L-alanine amidase|nr:N-acetylmuramoyl-L-alanine amidase [Verrucomicrobiales bacterium]MDP4791256.1 N-acetylmuramoyl-L-alanine amidase [Verrucomicrobiales bacterium]MDP5004905.1 N-acetylmuramoyl-L-alanine amidase [Verrucomicrobiales bacterium]